MIIDTALERFKHLLFGAMGIKIFDDIFNLLRIFLGRPFDSDPKMKK